MKYHSKTEIVSGADDGLVLPTHAMKSHKIPDAVNSFLMVAGIAVCLVSALHIRNGEGAVWFVALGASGYFVLAGLYQSFFKK